MKASWITTLVFFAALAHASAAGISTTPLAMSGSSMGPKATQLIQFLKELGVPPTIKNGITNYTLANGQITKTNGAVCDNGNATYEVTLDVMDNDNHKVNQIDVADDLQCSGISQAAKLSAFMDAYGASKLGGDCGLGHCRTTVNSISCTHFDDPKFNDMCSVITSNGMRIDNSVN